MPREASKTRGWEKERRERMKISFEELAKVLPSYDPSIIINKIDILKQAQTTIIELKSEIDLLTSSNQGNNKFKDEQVKKLQERVKKLLIRNEQLTNLFKNAGIKPPRVVGPITRFRKTRTWSNRGAQHTKQKKETEKENAVSASSSTKPKRAKLVSTNQAKSSKISNTPVKTQKAKKSNKKVSVTNSLLLLSQIPAVPAINQQLVLVPNTPLNNVSRRSTILTVPSTKTTKSTKATALTPVNLNLGSTGLGPGTLILGNGNIISLLPQPQLMIPHLNLPSQTVVLSKVVKRPKSNNSVKDTFLQPKRCITKTTQINKLPIPALTSKYANTTLLLSNSPNYVKKPNNKKPTKMCNNATVKGTKRKIDVESDVQPKNSKTKVSDEPKEKVRTETKKTDEINEPQISKVTENKEISASKTIENIATETSISESTVVESCSNITNENTNIKIPNTQNDINQKTLEEETSNQILERIDADITSKSLPGNNQISEKSDKLTSLVKTLSNKTNIPDKTVNSEVSSTPVSSSSTVTSAISVSVHEETMKNIDLTLVHSDLSNDIFASLQVPPGCQNTESTSPTAAFLLAFPLVSSIKVTEVIDEENSDSQRETPTLLQIGNMDNSKTNPNDNLLNLDNFPFFNTKDMCTSYYNSKEEINTNNENLGNNKNSEAAQNAKLDNETFNIYTANDRPAKNNFKVSYEMFPKSDSHILENKNNQKLGDTQNNSNHVRSVLNNEQYIMFEEEKSKGNGSNIFQQTETGNMEIKSFQKSGNEMVQIVQDKNVNRKVSNTYTDIPDKLQTACNVLSSNINSNYNITQENQSGSASDKYLTENILYKNFSEKDVQVQLRKQLDTAENTSNQMQYVFKTSNNNKDSSNEFNTNTKIVSNPQKQFVNKEHINISCNPFLINSMKNSEIPNQNLENCSNNNKTNNKINNTYHYNPFEIPKTSKEISLNVVDNCNKPNNNNIDKDSQTNKVDSTIRMNEVCSKSVDRKAPCYFSSNYSSTSGYKPDFSKPCPPCTYENQRNYSNPFYTNCNYSYNYPDANINQNYYKPDAKPCYSLNYENYQEYRKTDASFGNTINFTRDRKNSASKEKPVTQNKPVNWMTEQKSQASDCFLPSFTNQSYSFTSCISSDTNDINNLTDVKKTTDVTDKRFSWSPTKLPNFLEPTHNVITPTLPTLVGDLALGNSLPINDKSEYKYPKEFKRKTTYDNQVNFLSVSQLVNQNKTENVPARTTTRRLSGSKSKNMTATKPKRFDKNVEKGSIKVVNNFDLFYDQKSRNTNKNVISNYSAEALIGNQGPQETKKCGDNPTKSICSSNFLTENIMPYFTTVDDTYMNQNQNFHNTYTHNSFQNNSYPGNSFIYTTPSISSSYLTTNFEGSHDYSTDNMMNYCSLKDNKNCNNKNYRVTNKEEKHSYPSNVKKSKKTNQTNNGLGNFEYPLLPIQGTTNSPILPDDFQSHATFLPPTTPYPCKNSLYQKQGTEFNSGPLLPLPGISRNNIQHPQVSPSLNTAGTSLTNFNLSTIFPEINKGNIPNVHSSSNSKSKNNSNFLEGSFNTDSKYGFSG